MAPFIALYVLWVGRREIAVRPWILAPAVTVGALGVSVYLYVPLAANGPSPLQYNDPVTIDGFVWLGSWVPVGRPSGHHPSAPSRLGFARAYYVGGSIVDIAAFNDNIVGPASVPSAVIRIAVGVPCAVAAWRERSS